MEFRWDNEKNKENILKHGISFFEAKYVFNDNNAILRYDQFHSTKDEIRYQVIGLTKNGLLFVVHTYIQNNVIRIISCRKATKKRRKFTLITQITVNENGEEIITEKESKKSNYKNYDNDLDIPETSKKDWDNAVTLQQKFPEWFKARKETITIRLDKEVVARYKAMGRGYQTRINLDLRNALGLDNEK